MKVVAFNVRISYDLLIPMCSYFQEVSWNHLLFLNMPLTPKDFLK